MYEQVCYEKPFLTDVIARIDLVAPLQGAEKALPPKLANGITRHFPISEPVDAIAKAYRFTGEGVQQHDTPFKQWNFFGRDREKQLSIAPSFLLVSYKRYTTYEEMSGQFLEILDEVLRAFPDAKASRFGLRYVNVMEDLGQPGPMSWQNYFSAELLSAIPFFKSPENLTRLIHVAELKYDDLAIRFQFGMPNPDYPATIRRPQFVLDLDGYAQVVHDLKESAGYMARAHELIQDLFESSITDKLRELMHVRRQVAV